MFEFLNLRKSIKSNNSEIKTVNEQLTSKSYPVDIRPEGHVYQQDEFYTTIVNAFQTNKMQTSLDVLLYLFNNVTEVNAPITYIAQKGADIPIKHVRLLGDSKQKDLGETDLIKKLRQPNFLHDGRTHMINVLSSFFVFGYAPINIIKPVGWNDLSSMFLLPGNQFYVIPEKSINQFGIPARGVDFRNNLIVKYRLFIDAKPYDFDPSEIVMINDSNLDFQNGAYLHGQSRLYSAIRSIKTLSHIYDLLNTLIAHKGAEGFVINRGSKNTANPDAGYWAEDDRKKVLDKLYSFNAINGQPIGVSNANLDFLRISVPISDFIPIELKEHESRTVCTALLFPSKLLNDTKASTYNNVQEAGKAMYTDCLMPIVNLYYQGISRGTGLNEIGEAIVADYSEIECLQTNRLTSAQADKAISDSCLIQWNNNLITRNQWLEDLGRPRNPNPEFDKLKSELTAPEPVITNQNNDPNATQAQ